MQWPEFSTKSWRTLAWRHLSRDLSCSLPQPSLAKRIQTELSADWARLPRDYQAHGREFSNRCSARAWPTDRTGRRLSDDGLSLPLTSLAAGVWSRHDR